MSNAVKIGWGKRSIAMEGPVPITGQMHLRVSQGVFNEVLVSALVLDNSEDAAIFVSADMVGISPALVKKVFALLHSENPEIPVDSLIMNATHTHAGPSSNDIKMDYPLHMDVISSDDAQDFLARQFVDAICEAWQNRSAGSIAYGYGFAVTGHSRRTIYLDDTSLRDVNREPGVLVNGHGQMYGNTNDEMFDGYEAGTDPFINLMYTFDADGKLNGAVINVPCPAQTNENVWVLHGGFWNNVREKLTERYGEINIITQSAAGGDLSPRQMHYRAAELRRYKLKYPEKYADAVANPMKYHPDWFANEEEARIKYESEAMERMRAEDIADRIAAAFDEVLEWAQRDKMSSFEFKHEVRTVKLARRMFPQEQIEIEKQNLEQIRSKGFVENAGQPLSELINNSRQMVIMERCQGVIDRAAIQDQEPEITTRIHAVKIGNIAFVSNRFELFIDYMHRIQSRSPFEQTFIVQLTGDEFGRSSYLATERAVYNRGYSATPYCNHVSPQGGQELVNKTLEMLEEIR